jgi:hypothetical protein
MKGDYAYKCECGRLIKIDDQYENFFVGMASPPFWVASLFVTANAPDYSGGLPSSHGSFHTSHRSGSNLPTHCNVRGLTRPTAR